MSVRIPDMNMPLAGADGLITEQWYRFFQSLADASGTSGALYPQYQDVSVPPSATTDAGTAAAVSALSSGVTAVVFEAGVEQSRAFQVSVPRGVDTGYPIRVFAQVQRDGVAVDAVSLSCSCVWVANGALTVPTAQTVALTVPTGEAISRVVSAELSPPAGLGTESSTVSVTVTRGVDAFSGDVYVLSFGVVFQNSLPGTKNF